MKSLGRIVLTAACLTMIGCGSMARIMQVNGPEQRASAWAQDIDTRRQAGSFQVYNAEPYTVHLEFEETDLQQEGLEHLNGDGGASLNAYAACLTLKVIF